MKLVSSATFYVMNRATIKMSLDSITKQVINVFFDYKTQAIENYVKIQFFTLRSLQRYSESVALLMEAPFDCVAFTLFE